MDLKERVLVPWLSSSARPVRWRSASFVLLLMVLSSNQRMETSLPKEEVGFLSLFSTFDIMAKWRTHKRENGTNP